MQKCELIEFCCTFFDRTLSDAPGTASALERQLCYGDYSKCARYMVYKKLHMNKKKVPLDLFPHNINKAKQVIQQG